MRLLLQFFVFCFVALCSTGCESPSRLSSVDFEFKHSDGSVVGPVSLEIASTNEDRMQGLMYRKSMGRDSGMIFIFPKVEVHSFWMRNTYLSLDMIFLDESLTVLGVLEKVPPLNDLPRSIGKPGRYVIELNAGRARELGISEGSRAIPKGALPKGV